MNRLSIEELDKLVSYAKENQYVSVPLIQSNFGWTYSKARACVERLVALKRLKYDEGVRYSLIGSNEKSPDASQEEEPDCGDGSIDELINTRKRGDDEPFSIFEERRAIGLRIKILNSTVNKKRGEKNDFDYKPENNELPQEYEKLPQDAKDIVSFAVLKADDLMCVRKGLIECSRRWRKRSWGEVVYEVAIKYALSMTEDDFKKLKYILADGS